MTAITRATRLIRFKAQQAVNRYFDPEVPALEMPTLIEQVLNYIGHSKSHES